MVELEMKANQFEVHESLEKDIDACLNINGRSRNFSQRKRSKNTHIRNFYNRQFWINYALDVYDLPTEYG